MSAEDLRSAIAWIALAGFVMFTSIGAFLVEPWIGFVALGLTCGIAAYLVGADT
ncbi:MAG: hypothetical protein ACWGQW_12145 [bacterium]